MKNLLILCTFLVFGILAACGSGCCSMHVWQETGHVTTLVEETRADFTRPGELIVHMTGWQETAYLPWLPMGHKPWEDRVTLPLDRLPEKEIGLAEEKTYCVSTAAERFFETGSGLRTMAKHQRDIHPDDIRHLSEPFIYDPAGLGQWMLAVPLKVRESKDEYGRRVVHVGQYWAHSVHFPGDRFGRDMGGFGMTVWKCCLLPVPIVCDIATFPVQAFALLSYAIWGHKGVEGWWE